MSDGKAEALSRQLIRGATGTAGLSVVNTLLTLITGIVLARSLGPESYGIYAFVMSLVTLMGLPTRAGLPVLVVRETARNQLAERWDLLHGLLRSVNLFVVLFSILIAVLVFAVLRGTPLGDGSAWEETLLWALWLLPLVAFGNIRGATLRGLRKAVAGQLPEQFVKPVAQLLLLLALLLYGTSLTAERAMQVHVLSALAAFLVGAGLLWLFLPKEVGQSRPAYDYRLWWASLVPLSMIAGMKLIDSQLIVLLLGTMASAEEVGLYRVAVQGAALVTLGLTAVNMVLSPHVARLYREGDMDSLQRLVTLATRVSFLIALPIGLVLMVFGDPLIRLVFGVEYSGAALSLTLLCVGQLFNVGAGSVGVILNMAGYEKEALKAIAAALVVSVVAAAVLVPAWGSTGGAVAAASSLILWNSMMVHSVKKYVGLKALVV